MTQVKFLIEDLEEDNKSVFAYFPSIKSGVENFLFTAYSHIGQHSACHWAYAETCKEATKEEYTDLLIELEHQGYNDLEVLNKD